MHINPHPYDQEDPLRHFRQEFYLPKDDQGKPLIYFCGHSLGLHPKNVGHFIQQELEKWQRQGVEGHFREPTPWVSYHHLLKKPLAHLVGAREHEVVAMNNLTTNLHLMLVSFYRPTAQRYKILIEAAAFPSDHYAVESQVRFHGFDPADALVMLSPRSGEETLRTEDILSAIATHDSDLALVLLPGVQYYTGQFFNLPSITETAHRVGARAGFDLAHAIGNVPLQLHDWNVDFAVWCSYKYLNSGPGNNGGAFVHERYASDPALPRFAGWWGHDEQERFRMQPGFKPMHGVDGWQLSNVNILSMAAQRASLQMIEEATIQAMREKSVRLTGFLVECLQTMGLTNQYLTIITPEDVAQRGCQLSLTLHHQGKEVFEQLTQAGVIVDWREPNVIRVAPTPLYNTFEEVYQFCEILQRIRKGNNAGK